MPVAAPPPMPSQHTFAVVRDQLIDVSTLTLASQWADVRAAMQDGEVHCPTCAAAMKLVFTEEGPCVEHIGGLPYATHEPEDPFTRRAKHLLQGRLQELFPSGSVQLDVSLAETASLLDLLVVTGLGGKVAVEYQSTDLNVTALRARQAACDAVGITCLWMLDGRRFRPTKNSANKPIRRVLLDPLESAMLSRGFPLLYLDVRERQVLQVMAPAEAQELARLENGRRLGRVDCLVKRYSLAQLRIQEGHWLLRALIEPPAPPPPPLPDALGLRLAKARLKQRSLLSV